MTRLLVFFGLMAGLIFVFVLDSYKNFTVNNQKFDIVKVEKAYKEHTAKMLELSIPKVEALDEDLFVEYDPIVDLNTPQLVKGKKLFRNCISCHGKGGEGRDSQKAPHIGGQYDWYIEKQLLDMKSGTRINPVMIPMVKPLSPDDIKAVAAYISKLPWSKEKYLADRKNAAKN